MDLDAAAADQAERKAALVKALTAGPVDAGSAREQLEQLLPPETLADLDERVLAFVTGENEPEPGPASSTRSAPRRTPSDGRSSMRCSVVA
jgi:hypothetical protein